MSFGTGWEEGKKALKHDGVGGASGKRNMAAKDGGVAPHLICFIKKKDARE